MEKLGRITPDQGIREGTKSARVSKIKPLVPVLRQWTSLVQQFCEYVDDDGNGDGDNPYWYNERANVSLLAAAAWTSGNIALEEYLTTKKKSLEEAKNSRCRADLYIGIDKNEFEIEAKQYWMHSTMKDATLQRRIGNYLRTAASAAKENAANFTRVGCVFFIPHFQRAKSYGDARDLAYANNSEFLLKREIRRYVEANRAEADLWAWCFPPHTREKLHKEKDHSRFYPGVILALTVA